MKKSILTIALLAVSMVAFGQTNLLTNGDFELGNDGSWTGNAVNIQTDGGNSFNFANVMMAGAAFDVNISQTVTLVPGQAYILTFDASTGAGTTRDMVVGIGQSAAPFWADTEIVSLTENSQTFVVNLVATDDATSNDFGDATSRVLFDMGAAVGVVVIDNVSLVVDESASGGTVVEDFNAGTSVDGWTQAGNAASSPSEVTFEWAETAGVDGSGAMRWGGTNSEAVGKAYIVEKVFGGLDFGGATDVTVTVSVKSEGLTAANVSMLSEVGPGNIQNKGSINGDINDSGFSTITFDHTEVAGSANFIKLQVVVSPGANIGDGGTILIDNFSFSAASGNGGGELPSPTTAAPTPPARDAGDVVSIFSNAYTDVAVTTFATGWSEGTTATDVMVEGDDVKQFDFVNFSGIQLGNLTDLSGFTHMHIDYWVADALTAGEVFNVKLSNHGNGTENGETDASELTNPVTTSNEWVSLDIALSEFNVVLGTSALDNVYQLLLVTSGTLERIFVDNFYFYKEPSTSTDLDEVPAGFALEQNYPNPFNPSTNISYSIPVSGEVSLEVFNLQGQKVMTLFEGYQSAGAHKAVFDASNLASGVYVYRLVAGTNVQVRKMMLIK